jgi:membrane protease YdiL (CAAX protease family)
MPTNQISAPEFHLIATRPADSLAWIRFDLLVRLLPFALAVGVVEAIWRPPWLGLVGGRLGIQLLFGLIGMPLMFVLAMLAQLALTRRRGALRVPAGGDDALLQAGYYVLNGPLEEAFFRGLLQGGSSLVLTPFGGFCVATAAYVLYHRLGSWTWADTFATALAGVPFGLAFWLLPGPASIVGVSLAHIGATCGFLGPGPYLLRRLRLL